MKRFEHTTQRVLEALEISREEHSNLLFDRGLDYLQQRIDDSHLRKQISYARSFWLWWERQWGLRDIDFLKQQGIYTGQQAPPAYLLARYRRKHAVSGIEVYPGRVVNRLIRDEISNRLTIKT